MESVDGYPDTSPRAVGGTILVQVEVQPYRLNDGRGGAAVAVNVSVANQPGALEAATNEAVAWFRQRLDVKRWQDARAVSARIVHTVTLAV